MPLPNITTPEFKVILPSNKKELYFRPFLVKEEKALLLALEGGEVEEINNVVISLIENCVKYDGDIKELPYFDIEYLFLQLRSKSINNIVKFNLNHGSNIDCKKVNEYELDLNEVNVEFNDNHNTKIFVTDSIGVLMKYPTINSLQQINESIVESDVDKIFEMLANNIEYVFDSENVFEDFTKEELISWLENLNKDQFQNIVNFYNSMPTIAHTIEYTCDECGTSEKIELRGLQSFFM